MKHLNEKERFIWMAGRDHGISLCYRANARAAQGRARSSLVKLAREAQWEALRFLASAREAQS